MNPYPRTWVEIDLPALAHNVGLVRSRLRDPRTLVALVAKADAYGHGLATVSRYALAHGVDWIAVATVQEGIALREAGIRAPILVISPVLPIEAEQAVFYDLRVVIERVEMARALSEAAREQGTTAVVHLEVDTGLCRFGCDPEEALEIVAQIVRLPYLVWEGLASHFVDSGFDCERTREQIRQFEEVERRLREAGFAPPIVHVANSAGATLYPESQKQLVRVGISAYGIDPYGMFGGAARPVLSWKARVTSLRRRPAGVTVSYASSYRLTRPTRIATLGVGYGDGYPRALSNVGKVVIHGQRAPVIGLVNMDQLLVDVTDVPGVELGDEAELLGPSMTVIEVAKLLNTNVHEVISRVMSRVPRRYVYD